MEPYVQVQVWSIAFSPSLIQQYIKNTIFYFIIIILDDGSRMF